MAFNAPYEFKVNNVVVIQHSRNGNFQNFASIRVQADNHHEIARHGGKAEFAHWHAERQGDNKVMFKSKKGGKYLRIQPNGAVNASGGGGALCVFVVHHHQNGIVKLKNPQTQKWLAFNENKGFFAGGGGDHCRFKIWRNGQGGQHQGGGGGGGQHHNQQGPFSQLYQFKLNNTVVIQHRHNNSLQGAFKTIRVAQGGHGLQPGGGKGDFAQFYVEKKGPNRVTMKSTKNGKYIRIHQDGQHFKADCGGHGGDWCTFEVHHKNNGVVMLKGVKSGKFLAVRGADGVAVGGGGEHCRLKFFRK